jgi:hypothetical protein
LKPLFKHPHVPPVILLNSTLANETRSPPGHLTPPHDLSFFTDVRPWDTCPPKHLQREVPGVYRTSIADATPQIESSSLRGSSATLWSLRTARRFGFTKTAMSSRIISKISPGRLRPSPVDFNSAARSSRNLPLSRYCPSVHRGRRCGFPKVSLSKAPHPLRETNGPPRQHHHQTGCSVECPGEVEVNGLVIEVPR